MERPMNPTSMNPAARHDLSPGELDPELSGLVAQLERLGAADRASASAAMEALIVERSAPELLAAHDHALDQGPIVISAGRSTRVALRLAAAIAFAGVSLSVYLASLSAPGQQVAVAPPVSETASHSPATHLASAAMVRDWAAISSLYEDNSISSDIDILSAEVSRLHSSLDETADSAASSGAAGGAL